MVKPTFESLPDLVSDINQKIDRLEKLISSTIISSDDSNQVFDVNQAAKFLNLSVNALRGKIQRKVIPYSKSGRRIFFIKATLVEWLKGRSVPTLAEIEVEAKKHISSRKKGSMGQEVKISNNNLNSTSDAG